MAVVYIWHEQLEQYKQAKRRQNKQAKGADGLKTGISVLFNLLIKWDRKVRGKLARPTSKGG